MRTIYWVLISLVVAGCGAFLLLFWLAKPPVMQLAKSKSEATAPPPTVVAGDLTFLLGKQQVYYYFGQNTPAQPPTLHAAGSMLAVQKVLQAWALRSKGYVYIKSGEEAPYRQMVALLDEMNSTNQQHYSVVSPTEADQQLLARQQP